MDSNTCNKNVSFRELNEFDDGIESFLNYLHKEFFNFFFIDKITYKGKRIIISTATEEDGRLERFWHVISRQEDYLKRDVRFPETARCNAIHYIPIITSQCCLEQCANLLITERMEKKKKKVYLWCTNKNIMIVLEEMKNIYRFITCFKVRGKANKKKFLNRYNEYKKNKDD